ncbi:MAG: hypothetical protein AB7N76_33725 [Planctomycetota bacterium]
MAGDEPDQRADLYSFGVILFELLTGALPLTALTVRGFLREHLVAVPRTLASVRPEVAWPEGIERLLAQLLAKGPGQRPASAATVEAELHRLARPIAAAFAQEPLGRRPAARTPRPLGPDPDRVRGSGAVTGPPARS